MMASNLLSKLLPSNNMAPSIYEELRADDGGSDLEERAGMALDEENLGGGFHDYDLHHADLFNTEDSRVETESTTFLPTERGREQGALRNHHRDVPDTGKSKYMARSPRLLEDDGDDDVPASLLVEGDDEPPHSLPSRQRNTGHKSSGKGQSIPGPSTRDVRARWERTQAQQRLHQDDDVTRPQAPVPKPGLLTGSAREQALWTWINVTNLDHFMSDVYDYYRRAGIWSICLDRLLGLLKVTFVATFTTFLTQCVNYDEIREGKKMDDIVVKQCTKHMSGTWNFGIWVLALYTIYRLFSDLVDMRRLKVMHDFYLHLLNVHDRDIQTVSWQDIVVRMEELRDANPITAEKVTPAMRKYLGTQSKQTLDAHGIANRLMRRDNYFIALFNKEILDLTLPIPFLQSRQFFSSTMEWNLNYCIFDLVFNQNNQVRELVIKSLRRRELSDALRNRFLFAGFMNVLCAPVIVFYLLIVYFFEYFSEYQKNPAAIGSRQYTPLAEWKFREFNELPHLFEKRTNMSYPFASRYLDQFPKVKTVQIFRFVAFVSSAISSVLFIASIFDPELFLNFQITKDRTVLFYLGIFGTIWAVSRGAVPEENQVFDPEYALLNVIEYTHYMPNTWEGRLHSDEVKREFAELYQMKIVIFLEEILSIIFTPFVLWFSLPQCSDRIIDFFREFTIHVDGLGYVCSFAVFDFKKGAGNNGTQRGKAVEDLRDDYYSTKHGKMAASFHNFIDNYAINPKTGIPGHVPHGMRNQFHPPPSFPGLMSPTLAAEMQSSRMGRSERPRSRAPVGAGRTPRFPPVTSHMSPMPSMLLDAHHQPSSSGFGGRSVHQQNSRSRYLPRRNIEPIEDEEEEGASGAVERGIGDSSDPLDSGGLGESRWETSPTRNKTEEEDDSGGGNAAGVLGLLSQFHQKAQQTAGRGPGVHI